MKPNSLPALPGKTKPYVLAHRGNKVLCPENTLAAFRQALEDGADIIETDLHLSADGVFVCIHDATLDRTTNGRGPVSEKSLAELKKLSAHYHHPEFQGEQIPTLRELMAILPKNAAVALELKTDRFLEIEVCKKLVAVLQEGGVLERTVALSFSLPRIKMLQSVKPDLHIGWITLSKITPIKAANLLGPFWPILLANPFYVKIAHSRNQAVCPLDPNPDARLWLYHLLGCDAVLTDNPQSTCPKMQRLKNRN